MIPKRVGDNGRRDSTISLAQNQIDTDGLTYLTPGETRRELGNILAMCHLRRRLGREGKAVTKYGSSLCPAQVTAGALRLGDVGQQGRLTSCRKNTVSERAVVVYVCV